MTIDQEIHHYLSQNFVDIRDWCLTNSLLFEDPFFDLDDKYEWKRPPQITSDAQLIIDGIRRFDVLQGDLGNCWMLAAIAGLAMHSELVRHVVPTDQSFTSQYAGIFHFRFWQFGKWFDVVVDDRLPTKNGELVFTRSVRRNEFWSALFEKAYCKILGENYSAANAGNLCEALEDFTGGIIEQFSLEFAPQDFQRTFIKSVERRSLIGTFIDWKHAGTHEALTPEGLVVGHSYSVTGAVNVDLPELGSIALVRLRNPWGTYEWNGPWSDNSTEWLSVPESTKKMLGIVSADDGEFWMSYSDFKSKFSWVDMCHLSPDAFSYAYGSDAEGSTWQLNMFRDSWVLGITTGGAKSLHKNPQMRFALCEADAGNDEGKCSVLVALTQKTCVNVNNYNEIGFKVYRVSNPEYEEICLDRRFLLNNRSVGQAALKPAREVANRFSLPPGSYCVIPFIYEAAKEGEFLLRIYSEKRTETDQTHDKIKFFDVAIEASETPPMKIKSEEGKLEEVQLKDYFDTVSGGAKEVGWKSLKDIMDAAARHDVLHEPGGSWGNRFSEMAAYVYNRLFDPFNVQGDFGILGPGGFSSEVCRSMVASVDTDNSGKLRFHEFLVLWQEVQRWKTIYELYSEETEGCLHSSHLKEALETGGFRMNNRILSDVVYKYAKEDGTIQFNDFLNCSLKIKSLSQYFKSRVTNDPHKAVFTVEDFLQKAMYS